MSLQAFYWLALAIAVWVITGLLVPSERIGKLFNAGLVGGFLLSFVVNLLVRFVFSWWSFGPDVLSFMGIPLALPILWTAEVILYLQYLPEHKLSIVLYTTAFVVIGTILDYFCVKLGMRVYINWNLWATFVLGMISHSLVYAYYFITYPEAKTRLR